MELILEDADIITMATEPGPAAAAQAAASPAATGSPAAGSMLIRDGYIAAVGSAAQIRALAAKNAAVVLLDGATVIPGLIDAHCHVSDVGYLAAAADCSQPTAPDIPAIVARLRDQAGRTPDGSWVTGAGYVEYKLREDRHPTRADLDAAVPDRPAVLYHTSLHACVLNSAALRVASDPGMRRALAADTVMYWAKAPRMSRRSEAGRCRHTEGRPRRHGRQVPHPGVGFHTMRSPTDHAAPVPTVETTVPDHS